MSLTTLKKQYLKFPNEERQIGFLIALRSLSDDKKVLAWVKKELEVKRKAQKDNASFEWCYSKTDLSELIYALYHSDAIKKRGRSLTEEQMVWIFERLLGMDLSNYDHLLESAINKTSKRSVKGNYFIRKLLDKVEEKNLFTKKK